MPIENGIIFENDPIFPVLQTENSSPPKQFIEDNIFENATILGVGTINPSPPNYENRDIDGQNGNIIYTLDSDVEILENSDLIDRLKKRRSYAQGKYEEASDVYSNDDEVKKRKLIKKRKRHTHTRGSGTIQATILSPMVKNTSAGESEWIPSRNLDILTSIKRQ